MERHIFTDKALRKAKKMYKDSKNDKDIQLSIEELNRLAKQITDMVFLAPDEKIEYLTHFQLVKLYMGHGVFDRPVRYGSGDLIITSNKLLYGEHPITEVKKGLFHSQRDVHHDHYLKPIAVRIGLSKVKEYGVDDKDQHLFVVYNDDYTLEFWGGERDDSMIELEKAIDAYEYAETRPRAVEVVHKGTVVSLNVNSKGFLLNVDPCPTCGANLYLSQDKKTAYCTYCKKEIPTVKQIRES